MPIDEIEAKIDELLKGAIDLGCQTGPVPVGHAADPLPTARAARDAGMAGLVLNNHFYPMTPVVQILRRHEFANSTLELVSGVALNTWVGGLNVYAVEHDVRLGGRVVWMPTLSADNDRRHTYRQRRTGPMTALRPQRTLSVLDDLGRVRDELGPIFDLIAGHDAVLAAGHLHISEILPLFRAAEDKGVTRLLLVDPVLYSDATDSDLRALSDMGVFVAVTGQSIAADPDSLAALLAAVPPEQIILASGAVPSDNQTPLHALRAIIAHGLAQRVDSGMLRVMLSTNPARLLGLAPDQGAA